MQNRISFFLAFFVVLLILGVSCQDVSAQGTEETGVTCVSWNVQNLFDSVDDGTEYSEYKTENGWKETYYRERLRQISKVFSYGEIKSASIIVLNEVENERVVKDILELSPLKKRNFKYYAVAKEENGAISLAVLSSIPIKNAVVHKFDSGRPILQTEFTVKGKTVFLFALHAKSNLGNSEEDKSLRYNLALSLIQITDQIRIENPMCSIVVAGDFNEQPEDKNMFADMRLASNVNSLSPIRINSYYSNSFFCSIWLDPKFESNASGSYYYRGEWKCYDNILLYGVDSKACGVLFEGVLKDNNLVPFKWDRNLLCGVSDHLPVWTKLEI